MSVCAVAQDFCYCLEFWVVSVLLLRTVPSLKPTMPSWFWPTRARCSSTRSPRRTPACSWTSGGRCLATSPSTWPRRSTHSFPVRDGRELRFENISEVLFSQLSLMKNDLWLEEEAPWCDKWPKVCNKTFYESHPQLFGEAAVPDVGVGGDTSRLLLCVQKLQAKDLTFTVRSAIQLKYQSGGIKAPAPLTLTEVLLKWRSQSHWYIDKCTLRHQKKRLFLVLVPSVHLWGFMHRASWVMGRPRSLFLPLSFRAFKGAFHGGAAERSTQVHACQLPPPLPCQQARYWSVIDCRVVTDGQRESIELISACVQCDACLGK